jgi:hypothetical protein
VERRRARGTVEMAGGMRDTAQLQARDVVVSFFFFFLFLFLFLLKNYGCLR